MAELESPLDQKNVSGVKPIYGWALDEKGISKIELFVDGIYLGNIPYGGIRQDVKEAHPEYPGAGQSGFAMVWNYSVLPPGEHTLLVRIHNLNGETLNLPAKVNVVKFHGEMVSRMTPEDYFPCEVSVTADGTTRAYDVYLEWYPEVQDFGISQIIPKE